MSRVTSCDEGSGLMRLELLKRMQQRRHGKAGFFWGGECKLVPFKPRDCML